MASQSTLFSLLPPLTLFPSLLFLASSAAAAPHEVDLLPRSRQRLPETLIVSRYCSKDPCRLVLSLQKEHGTDATLNQHLALMLVAVDSLVPGNEYLLMILAILNEFFITLGSSVYSKY